MNDNAQHIRNKQAMLEEIVNTGGAEIRREWWPLAEELVVEGKITLGPPRGPGKNWRRAEISTAIVEEAAELLGSASKSIDATVEFLKERGLAPREAMLVGLATAAYLHTIYATPELRDEGKRSLLDLFNQLCDNYTDTRGMTQQ